MVWARPMLERMAEQRKYRIQKAGNFVSKEVDDKTVSLTWDDAQVDFAIDSFDALNRVVLLVLILIWDIESTVLRSRLLDIMSRLLWYIFVVAYVGRLWYSFRHTWT